VVALLLGRVRDVVNRGASLLEAEVCDGVARGGQHAHRQQTLACVLEVEGEGGGAAVEALKRGSLEN